MACGHVLRKADHASCNGRRLGQERVSVELHAERGFRNEVRRSHSSGILEVVGVFARNCGCAIEGIDDSG